MRLHPPSSTTLWPWSRVCLPKTLLDCLPPASVSYICRQRYIYRTPGIIVLLCLWFDLTPYDPVSITLEFSGNVFASRGLCLIVAHLVLSLLVLLNGSAGGGPREPLLLSIQVHSFHRCIIHMHHSCFTCRRQRAHSHTRKTLLVAQSPHATHTHEHSSERSQPWSPEPLVYINSWPPLS